MGRAESKNKNWVKPTAIPLNVDFFLKPRNREFIAEFGWAGIVCLLQLWCAIAREKSLKISKAQIQYVHFAPSNLEFAPDENYLKSVFCAAVEKGLLDEDGENYFNSQITKYVIDLSTYESAQNNGANSVAKYRAKSAQNKSDFATLYSSSKVTSNNKSKLKHLEDLSRISKKSNLKHLVLTSEETGAKSAQNDGAKSRGRPSQNPIPKLPDDLAPSQNEFDEFATYRKKVKKKPVTQRVADKLFALYKNQHIAFSQDLLEAIDNGWIRLRRQFEEFATSGANNGVKSFTRTAQNKKTNVDRNLELLSQGLDDE